MSEELRTLRLEMLARIGQYIAESKELILEAPTEGAAKAAIKQLFNRIAAERMANGLVDKLKSGEQQQ
jgi:hypothetical protein